jgi:hypothetical protein
MARPTPGMKRLLLHAGLDPDHALVRWGNYDWTLLLRVLAVGVQNLSARRFAG